MYCLQCFRYEKALINHKENCIKINGTQAIKMPKADDMVYFKNCHKVLEVPFVIYGNFEAINEKVHGCQPNNDKSYTESYQQHKGCGYGYKVAVLVMISRVNQVRYIEETVLFISSWKKMLEEVE